MNWLGWSAKSARSGDWNVGSSNRGSLVKRPFAPMPLDRLALPLQLQIERLRSGVFVQEGSNVIAVGPPGVGKSHVACALGHELILQGHSVLWTTTTALVQRLLAAKRDLHLPQELARLDRCACLILDDIGYVQHDRDEMEVLVTRLSQRYEQRSVIITTNLLFSAWDRIFKDPMTTLAAIDRVVHHSAILDMTGVQSFRAQQAHEHQHPPSEVKSTQSSVPAG